MTAPVLGDVLGPRGRTRVLLASVVSAVVLAAFVVIAFGRLRSSGQLAGDKWQLFKDPAILRFLGKGLLTTLELAGVSMGLAIVFGSLLALGRLAKNGPTRWLTGGWVEVFRAVPLLLMIYFAARGLPRLGVDLPGFWYVVAGLTFYNSAVLAEIFRSGILSLDRGQTEAASALGMTYWQAMLLVVVPQAFRRMVPAIVSQLITLLKDTSLAFIVPVEELLQRSYVVGAQPGKPVLQALFVAALIYIAVNFTLSRVARRLEVRQRRRYGAGGIAVTGAEDLAAVNAQADRSAGS
jgi:glutamate transport system permease protein